ncbi:UDP-glucose,sterol transferase [Chaetomium sp. MPI-CAGE-AT-0009]|nr:UDP-glucose,sterol transferase [Chaetomium sp. MPI-CAGE-AT-0009]
MDAPREAKSMESQDCLPPSYDAAVSHQYRNIDDGRIQLDTSSRLFRTLSRLIPEDFDSRQPNSSANDKKPQDEPPIYQYSRQPSPNIRLNIVMHVVGSRGDVQPFVALGNELLRHGHRVRLATHSVFRDFVSQAGLEFFPIGGDPAELMAYMVKNPGLIPSMGSLRAGEVQKKRQAIAEILNGAWASCIRPDPATKLPFTADTIIANPPSFAHIHCAQALGIPLHLMFTMPWSSTRAFPHPLTSIDLKGSGISVDRANYLSYLAVEWMTWQGLGDLINAWRDSLDLEPISRTEGPCLAEALKIPFTYCWSPSLVAKPADWPENIDVCGFFFRDPPNYQPDAQLAAFLRDGPPPVYIGFGSIVVDDPAKLTATLVVAVRQVGCRAIISRGWSKLGADLPPSQDILWLGDCPHEWLFQHVSAVVHHGGAGTAACGLLNARPTVIVPFFGDQPFWGKMVASAGAGPEPIPQKQLSSEKLALAIEFCLTEEASAAAKAVSQKMKTEFGVQQAVESFHANLPLSRLRCELLNDQPASWSYVKGNKKVRLSKVAAQILVDNGCTTWSRLSRYEPSPIRIDVRRWDPASAVVSSLMGTWTGMATSAADIVIEPIKAYQKPETSAKDDPESQLAMDPKGTPGPHGVALETSGGTRENASGTSNNRFARAALGSASGVGKFFHHFSKGMLLDMPMAATEGLRAVPKLYGKEVEERPQITDWKSGAVVAGTNFHQGVVGGFKDLIREPIDGGRQEGALGVAKGVGKGLVGMTTKVTSGVLGLVSYSGQGVYQTTRDLTRRNTRRAIDGARREEARYALSKAEENGIDEVAVLQAWSTLTGRAL